MGVGIYYFYHGFGLEAFEGRHIRIYYNSFTLISFEMGRSKIRHFLTFEFVVVMILMVSH